MTDALALRAVDKSYGPVTAVRALDLEVAEGEVLTLIGPSGCGKSTLLRLVAGLERSDAGSVTVGGDIVDHDRRWIPPERRRVGLVFQDHALFPHLDVAGNIAFGLRRLPAGERRGRVAEMLEVVGLAHLARRHPHELSGGEQQRVALARALAPRPAVVLLDEPLSALDAGLRERLAGDLRDILRRAGTTAVMVTHDHDEAYTVADRLVVMRAGRVVQQGAIAEVWARPADPETALFLGYARVLRRDAAGRVLAAGGLADAPAVAVRRSALTVDPDGPLAGEVVAARATPDQVRLVVEVDGVGEVDAVAASDRHPGPGERVRLAVDAARLAPIPAAADRRRSLD